MKKIVILLLFFFVGSILSALEIGKLDNLEVKNYHSTISNNPMVLAFGLPNANYEFRINNRFGVEGSYAKGKLLFVDITNMFGASLKYYVGENYNKGLYYIISYTMNEIDYKKDHYEFDCEYAGLGYFKKWKNGFTLGMDLGFSFSSQDRVKYEKHSGNVTKTVTVGGSSISSDLTIGYSF